ncbi:MAG: spore coat protein SP96 [Eggerthellaceae bacterium]|jgi:hypothetical protein
MTNPGQGQENYYNQNAEQGNSQASTGASYAPAPPAAPAQPSAPGADAYAAQPQPGTQVPPYNGTPGAAYANYQQPVPPAPVANAPVPPTPLYELTGGMKFGWFLVGCLAGIPGILIAWLTNVDKYNKVKSDAIKFSIIGFVVNIVFVVFIVSMIVLTIIGLSVGSGAVDATYSMYY